MNENENENLWKLSDEGGGTAERALPCELCSDMIEVGDQFQLLENNQTSELITACIGCAHVYTIED